HDALAVTRDHLVEELRVAQRRRADHHALHPGSQYGLNRVCVAQSTAGLHGHVDLAGDPLDVVAVRRAPGTGAVQVHDVQPLGPGLDPALRSGDRIGVVDRLLRVVAAHEPHGLAAADV